MVNGVGDMGLNGIRDGMGLDLEMRLQFEFQWKMAMKTKEKEKTTKIRRISSSTIIKQANRVR